VAVDGDATGAGLTSDQQADDRIADPRAERNHDRARDHTERHTLVILKITWDSWHTVAGTEPGELVEPHKH
jgi:hypothetical protein